MTLRRILLPCSLILANVASWLPAQTAGAKPAPDAAFGNWLFKTPDPKIWKRTEQDGNLVFSVDEPPGDYCRLTLFAGAPAEPDFGAQFNAAVTADQKARDTVKIEADSGAKPSKSAEGFDVLTRNLRSATSALHTFHAYVGAHSGDRFDLAAFQTTSEGSWQQHGAEAAQFLLSLKLRNSLAPEEVERLVGKAEPAAAPPPALPGFDEPAPTAATPAGAAMPAAATAAAAVAPRAEQTMPEHPLAQSPLVVNDAVVAKNGKPIDGLKLSQHDKEIYSPSLAVDRHNVIHVAFVEKHRTTFALAVYHRSVPTAERRGLPPRTCRRTCRTSASDNASPWWTDAIACTSYGGRGWA